MRFLTWLAANARSRWPSRPGSSTASASRGPTHGSAEIQEKLVPLLLVSLILGVVSAFVKPILKILSIPFIILTLGLFLLVINAADADADQLARRPVRHRLPRRRASGPRSAARS